MLNPIKIRNHVVDEVWWMYSLPEWGLTVSFYPGPLGFCLKLYGSFDREDTFDESIAGKVRSGANQLAMKDNVSSISKAFDG